MFIEEWPINYLPKELPKYPSDSISGQAEPGHVLVIIEETSETVFSQYMSALKVAKWNLNPTQQYFGQAYKDNWLLQYGYNNGEATLQFMTDQ